MMERVPNAQLAEIRKRAAVEVTEKDVPKLLAEIERLKTSLVKIRDSHGNPYNSHDAVIIARNAIQIAKFAVGDSHD